MGLLPVAGPSPQHRRGEVRRHRHQSECGGSVVRAASTRPRSTRDPRDARRTREASKGTQQPAREPDQSAPRAPPSADHGRCQRPTRDREGSSVTLGARERKFEGAIEAWLLEHGGYVKGDPHAFDVALGLDPGEVLAFVRATQEDAWRSLAARHGGEAAAEANFLRRLAKELDERGTVDVLRHGVKDLGVEIRVAYFKPAHGLTPELVSRYEANRLVLVRQFRYDDSGNEIDLALYVNGIPVATAELKNPLTNQNVEHAIAQYRRDR